MRGEHDFVGLILGHPELGLQHRDHEVARRVVVVDQDHLVQLRLLDLDFGLGLRLQVGVAHSLSDPLLAGEVIAGGIVQRRRQR